VLCVNISYHHLLGFFGAHILNDAGFGFRVLNRAIVHYVGSQCVLAYQRICIVTLIKSCLHVETGKKEPCWLAWQSLFLQSWMYTLQESTKIQAANALQALLLEVISLLVVLTSNYWWKLTMTWPSLLGADGQLDLRLWQWGLCDHPTFSPYLHHHVCMVVLTAGASHV